MPDIKKHIKFSEEQTRILSTLLHILNINGNYTFLLSDLDENMELQRKILDLGTEVRRFHPSSGCSGINGRSICKRPYLSIIRYVLKYHRKELYSNDYAIPLGDHRYKKTKKYKIVL
jgi:hypothetical protein